MAVACSSLPGASALAAPMLRCGEARNRTGAWNPALRLFGLSTLNGTLAIQHPALLLLGYCHEHEVGVHPAEGVI